MRDFTKSVASYAWAMSVFGVQQMANLLMPRQGIQKATESMDHVTAATKEQLGDSMRAAFRAGDELQKSMIDIMFSGMMIGTGSMGQSRPQNPSGSPAGGPSWSWGPPRGKTAEGAPDMSVPPTGRFDTGRPAAQTPPDQEIGWGPMP